jgi:FKBP-type peptidyl-prolyl cis-trans isomerase
MNTKKLLYLLVFASLIISVGACKDDDDISKWRDANIAAYQAITKKTEFRELRTASGPEGVYYKTIKSGTGSENPIQTSRVKVLYKGTEYDGFPFDHGTSRNNIPVELYLASTVRGFSFALQNMVVGDKWEIWIPYYLGYGAAGLREEEYPYRVIIRGYTTLIFEVELLDINQYPD